MDDVALGVKVFQRTEKLERLFDSVEDSVVSHVYVADDGETTEAAETLYDRSYDFDLTVLDLEYDAGLGYGRAEIVEALEEEYLLIVDSDHELRGDAGKLREILVADERLGGVSGLLLERGQIAGTCHDLLDRGSTLIRDVRERKPVETAGGHPVVRFDFLPNVAMFRRECVEEYCWDREYVIGKEHVDFYEGHRRHTDWEFAVCPTVLFGHYPGGDASYVENREAREKLDRSRAYFMEKWGYDRILLGQTEWYDPTAFQSRETSHLARSLFKRALFAAPPAVQDAVAAVRDRVRRARSRPPL